ncbi:MAG: pseudouridine synthase, partial [Lachnospiraceae bacterium]|nr:pseudouridine synthase [Lachnospiraceae bacterium]
MRLNKYLASCGICSRREADMLIERGEVLVNGIPAQSGMQAGDGDEVIVKGKPVSPVEEKVVLAFYKPFGVTCTDKDTHAEQTVRDVLNYPIRLAYAGRLDRDSEGLLLLSNDGDLIHGISQGSNHQEKEYIVRVSAPLKEDFLRQMGEGVYLPDLGVKTRPAEVRQTSEKVFHITLTQGLNRQIRRMCSQLHYHVEQLIRIRIMNIGLGNLTPGHYRQLKGAQLEELYR